MHALRWAAVALLSCRATGLWCYESYCSGEDDIPPCATAATVLVRQRNCGARGIDALPTPSGGGSYDRCLRTQVSGVVPYTTPSDDGISYYACGSSGGYSCDDDATRWDSDGLIISEVAANITNGTVLTPGVNISSNATVSTTITSRWCCAGQRCNEPTQMRSDREAAEAAALAAAYAMEPTLGFEYMQSPTWTAGSCDMSAVGDAEAMYVPINDFGLAVEEVGTCKQFNRRGLLDDILTFYTGNGRGRSMKVLFLAHCVECNTMPGDGYSPFAAAEGRTSATHYFYASSDCDQLTLLYTEEYTLGSCLASGSMDGTNHIARCGQPRVGTCPKPAEGFTIKEFADIECQLPVNRFVAWNASWVGQCVSDFSPLREKTGFLPSTARSAKVCCTAQTATVYYFTDAGCTTPHDPNADEAELGMVIPLRTCARSDDLSSQYFATCAMIEEECPALGEVGEEESLETRRSTGSVTSGASSADETSDPTIIIIVGCAIVGLLAILWLTKSKWMTGDQQAKLNKLLHGAEEIVAEERAVEPKEKTEKQKIMEQYRAASFQDGAKQTGKDTTARLGSKSMPALPGATHFDEDVEDPMQAAKMATAAIAKEKAQLKRDKSQDKTGRVHSSSHRSKGSKSGSSSREHKSSSVRSPSHRGHHKHKDTDKLRSKSMASPKDHGKNKEHLKSASEGSRRKAMQHNLKQMKNLEAAKQEVGADNRRGDSIVACRALFDRIDVDGSGTLDRNEISMLATKMGRGLKAEELDAAMAAMDKDGNGTVDFDEFYSWYSGSSRSMGKAEVKVLAYLKRSKDG